MSTSQTSTVLEVEFVHVGETEKVVRFIRTVVVVVVFIVEGGRNGWVVGVTD